MEKIVKLKKVPGDKAAPFQYKNYFYYQTTFFFKIFVLDLSATTIIN